MVRNCRRVRTRAQDRALDWERDSQCSWAGNGSSKEAHHREQLLLNWDVTYLPRRLQSSRSCQSLFSMSPPCSGRGPLLQSMANVSSVERKTATAPEFRKALRARLHSPMCGKNAHHLVLPMCSWQARNLVFRGSSNWETHGKSREALNFLGRYFHVQTLGK